MEEQTFMSEIGCFYCYDNKKHREKEQLYFFDAANNLKTCEYCPKCGRKYGEVLKNEYVESDKSDAIF